MASAEQLKMTHSIEGQVQGVRGDVQDIGDKVQDKLDHVRTRPNPNSGTDQLLYIC
jgi:hypothetical protein